MRSSGSTSNNKLNFSLQIENATFRTQTLARRNLAELSEILYGRVGWGVMGQRGEMGILFEIFMKKYRSCINKRLWSQ